MINRVKGWVLAATVLLCAQVGAASLSDIQVSNGDSQARITFSFMGDPEYAFSQIDSRSVALDIKQTGVIQAAAPVQRQQSGEKHPFGNAEGYAVSASGGRSHRKGQNEGG